MRARCPRRLGRGAPPLPRPHGIYGQERDVQLGALELDRPRTTTSPTPSRRGTTTGGPTPRSPAGLNSDDYTDNTVCRGQHVLLRRSSTNAAGAGAIPRGARAGLRPAAPAEDGRRRRHARAGLFRQQAERDAGERPHLDDRQIQRRPFTSTAPTTTPHCLRVSSAASPP